MSGLCERILGEYQVRKTRTQKRAFEDMLRKEFPDMQVQGGGFMKSRNLIVGDIQRAEVIFTAHYDTCAVSPFPNLIMPYRNFLRILYAVLIVLPYLALMIGIEVGLIRLGVDSSIAMSVALLAYWAAFAGVFFIGRPNRHTANDNTSGVLALCAMLQRFSPGQLQRAAFIFFDNEEYGLLGSRRFYREHKILLKEKLIFNMDCVGDGDNMLFVISRGARDKWEARLKAAFPQTEKMNVHFEDGRKIKFPSDQKHFPVSVAAAALHPHRWLKLCVGRIHTSRDVMCSMENIDYLCDGAQKLL